MRDVFLFGAVFGLIPMVLLHPWIGTMLWTWVSIMNPHRLTWGAANGFPFAAVVAVATILGLIITKDRRKLPINALTIVLMAFIAWMCVTTALAIYPDRVGEMFRRVMKIQFMIFVTLALLHTRKHVEMFIWVMVISIGFYGLKGGIFTLLSGGGFRVWGPAGSFIEGNNEMALALVIVIPLMQYLQRVQKNRWIRYALVTTMIFTALAALGTQSRGAFLAIAAMSFILWLRSPQKIPYGFLLLLVAIALIAFMPDTWMSRMQSIRDYEQDNSAVGRLNAWMMAWNLAVARPIGGGFEVITPELFARFAPVPTDIHAAHSIYFQILGEHGFLGLGLFLLLWILTWRSAGWVIKHGKATEELRWTADLAAMMQVALTGYFVGGAFLSLAYFDLPYNMIVAVVVCRVIIQEQQGRHVQAATVHHRGHAPARA